MANVVQTPYPMFFDADGRPIEGGRIFFGVAGLNPLSNPQAAYWDKALTLPAADVRISGGFIINNGCPSKVFFPGDFSLLVKDKNDKVVYSSLFGFFADEDLYVTETRGSLTRSARSPSSFNFDLILESGFYSWTNAATTNFPSTSAAANLFSLTVINSPDGSGSVYQSVADLTQSPGTSGFSQVRKSLDAGATWTAWSVASPAVQSPHRIVLTGAQVYTWTAPAGVTAILLTACGAGGKGGNGIASTSGGGGGGSGAYCRDSLVTVVPGTAYTFTLSTSGASTMTGSGFATLSFGKGGDGSGVTAGSAGVASGTGVLTGYAGGAGGAGSGGKGGGGGGLGGRGGDASGTTTSGGGGGSSGSAVAENPGNSLGRGYLSGAGGKSGSLVAGDGGGGSGGQYNVVEISEVGGCGGGGGGGVGVAAPTNGSAGGAPFFTWNF